MKSIETPYAPSAREIRQIIRTKAPEEAIAPHISTIESEASARGISDPAVPSTDALVTSILFLGSKSFSHVLSYVERCKDRLLAIGIRSPAARRQIITSTMEYWASKPGTAVNVVDKLLNYTILTPMSVVEWALIENLGKGNLLAQTHVYEMVAGTLQKVTNRVRQLAVARNASRDPQQRKLVEETLEMARTDMRQLFNHVEDGLKGIAEGSADQMLDQEGGIDEEEQARLREWGVRWLRVFRRKLAVEESWVGEMMEVEVTDEELKDVREERDATMAVEEVNEGRDAEEVKVGAYGDLGVNGTNGADAGVDAGAAGDEDIDAIS